MSDLLDPRFLGSVFVTLFVIMDPPGTVPIFLALTSSQTGRQRSRSALQAVAVSLAVIVVFAVFGESILTYLRITLPALQIAGGLLLLLVALELLTGRAEEPAGSQDVNVALVPLGTPLLAGPGAIVATIVFVRDAEGSAPELVAVGLAIVAVHLCLWLAMRFAGGIHSVIGTAGITVVTRIAGLLLSAIAVQLVVDGVTAFIRAG